MLFARLKSPIENSAKADSFTQADIAWINVSFFLYTSWVNVTPYG